ncbi:hypothetical protein GEV33_005517 [Tenebrio molitor]|uniref:Uncharacterized protein n=1 Tax=Tenebrio molitor TaxID=7067 RepID=A0A8J6HMB8_TENMO|nr:hypothetical protein GEV33_005517 [Tenebrio molitor]
MVPSTASVQFIVCFPLVVHLTANIVVEYIGGHVSRIYLNIDQCLVSSFHLDNQQMYILLVCNLCHILFLTLCIPASLLASIQIYCLLLTNDRKTDAEADGLPYPLSPTHKLRAATPVAHGAAGLGSLAERFMGKQIVVCHLPVAHLGAKTADSPVLFLPEGKKDVTPHPRRGPLQCFPRIGPPKDILTPAPRPPYGGGSRQPEAPTLGPCHRSSDKPLISVSFPSALPSRYFGELSAPLVQKRMIRGPSTLVHLSGTSSNERNR